MLNNDYPLNFIFDTINNRLKILFNKKMYKQSETSTTENNKNELMIHNFQFGPIILEQFKKIIKNLDVKLSYYSFNKLENFKIHKKLFQSIQRKKNVAYKIKKIL